MKNYLYIILLSMSFIVGSCSYDLIETIDTPQVTTEGNARPDYSFSEGPTVLGKDISIPYSIDNLRAAFDLLPQDTKSGYTIEDIQPTHYYIKFSPTDGFQLDLLRNTPGLILSEVPLDREIVVGGIYYHDPELPMSQPTYQYSTLEIEYWQSFLDTLSVDYEVLIEAYIPEEITSTKTINNITLLPNSLYSALLKESYRITGNEYDILPETKGSQWCPTGRIRAYDNIVNGYVPIQDVVVRGTHFLTIKETTTDANGYFALPLFNGSVTLKVVWEGDQWDVRYGDYGQAVYEGPQLSSGTWFLDIMSSQTGSLNLSAVFRAVRRVYMGFNYGFSRPNYNRRLKIAYIHDVLDNNKTGEYLPSGGMGIGPDIRIAGKNSDNTWRQPSLLFSTTCHELGHATHNTNASSIYESSEQRVKESWAIFHQYLCTIKEYTDLNVVSNLWTYSNGLIEPDIYYNFQLFDSSINYFQTYTSLFVDIYDTYNQHDFCSSYINDVISGFYVPSLESVVFGKTSFAAIKQHFLNLVNTTGYEFGITVESVNELFSIYDGF